MSISQLHIDPKSLFATLHLCKKVRTSQSFKDKDGKLDVEKLVSQLKYQSVMADIPSENEFLISKRKSHYITDIVENPVSMISHQEIFTLMTAKHVTNSILL